MTVLDNLHQLSSAEDFFHALDVPYEQEVLNVARLHILRRMGQYLKQMPAGCSEEEAYERARGHLLRAYLDFVRSSPLEERVFKVHQQAYAPSSASLVSIQLSK